MIWSHVIALSLICGGAVAISALVGESAVSAWRARRADRAAQRAVAAAILTPDTDLDTSGAAACGCEQCRPVPPPPVYTATGLYLSQTAVDRAFDAIVAGLGNPVDHHLGDDHG